MHKMMLAVTLTFAIGTTAQAQSWMYQTGPGGTPPAMYNTPYAPQNIPSPYLDQPPQPQYTPPPTELPTRQPVWSSPRYEPPLPIYVRPTMPGYDDDR